MNAELKNIKINNKTTGFFRFKKLDNNYLLTNDVGFFIILTTNDFKNFLEGKLNKKSAIHAELSEKGFIKNIDIIKKEGMARAYRIRNAPLFNSGPSLNIIAVTLRCNQKCIYCQANARDMKEKEYNMTVDTAKKVVDLIFKIPNKFLTIEFQGGEPLANWSVVKFIIAYAKEKNKFNNKQMNLALVSNLTLMTKDKLDFLIDNKVSICTSLDGPEKIHNKNRLWAGNNNYQSVTRWMKKIQKKYSPELGRRSVNALVTISKHSLPYHKEIIDEYIKWGILSIHLRPLSYLGMAKTYENTIGYSSEDFMSFWTKGMDYIILKNQQGVFLQERGAQIMLQKMLTKQDPGYTDLKSPCGGALGQIVYDYNGKIYTCDEARMLDNNAFMLGNVKDNDYQEAILSNQVKIISTASCLDNLSCDYCVYKPYCGVCPVRNYAIDGNLFPQIQNTDWCKINMAQFDYLFKKIQDPDIMTIFKKWMPNKSY